jgi:hypothetical protein
MNAVTGLREDVGTAHVEDVGVLFCETAVGRIHLFVYHCGECMFHSSTREGSSVEECQRWLWQQFMDSLYA